MFRSHIGKKTHEKTSLFRTQILAHFDNCDFFPIFYAVYTLARATPIYSSLNFISTYYTSFRIKESVEYYTWSINHSPFVNVHTNTSKKLTLIYYTKLKTGYHLSLYYIHTIWLIFKKTDISERMLIWCSHMHAIHSGLPLDIANVLPILRLRLSSKRYNYCSHVRRYYAGATILTVNRDLIVWSLNHI